MKNLSLIYLLHFLYIPLILIYAILIGEDAGSIGLYLILSFILSLILYVFNLGISSLVRRYTTKKVLVFYLPVVLLIILYLPVNWVLDELDIGGEKGYSYILIGTLLINTISFYLYDRRD